MDQWAQQIYCINNTVIFNHDELVIHLDLGYLGSFYDVTLFRHSNLYCNRRSHLTHIDQYIEYLLGDMGYIGEEMFIMQCIGQYEVSLSIDNRALHS